MVNMQTSHIIKRINKIVDAINGDKPHVAKANCTRLKNDLIDDRRLERLKMAFRREHSMRDQ